MEKKSLFKSKTLWVNAIIAVLAFFPDVQKAISPDMLIMLFAVANMILRVVTKEPVDFFGA